MTPAAAELSIAAEAAPEAEAESWRPPGELAANIVADLARACFRPGKLRDMAVTRRKSVVTREIINLGNQVVSWLGDLDSNQD